jgi:signal transduction histidine kinase
MLLFNRGKRVLLKLETLSIRTKVFICTSVTLAILLLFFVVIFNNLFMQIKNNAFSDYKLLSTLDHQVTHVSMSTSKNIEKELTKITKLAKSYQQLAVKNNQTDEQSEFKIANNIVIYSDLYSQQRLKTESSPLSSETNSQRLSEQLSITKLQLLNAIHQALNITQSKANEDLERLFYYEMFGFIILFLLILFFAMYGINLVITPLIKLRKSIEDFQGEKHSQITGGDEIKLLIDSFFSMKNEIKHKQELLEEAVIQAQDANKEKSEFLANISHELRTPMLGILGFAELGLNKIDKVEKHKIVKYFDRIHTSGSRLLLLLNNLLDLSKLEAGEMQFDFEQALISDVLNNVITELDALIINKHISIITDSPNDNIMVEMDVLRIHQVFYNVINNAIKFSPEQGVIFIEISQQKVIKAGQAINTAIITIQDQGMGVPEEELDYIFKKFSQSSMTNTGAGGTGLGLSICKDICEHHNASISIENLVKPKKGATFTIKIPLSQTN